MSMIPNPRKSITIDFTIQEVGAALKRVPGYAVKYPLHQINEVFHQYTFGATEFLSMGVFIDVGLNEVSATRTEVSIEVRRKVGAFDQWYEVQHANKHIANLIDALTKLLMNGRDPEKYSIVQQELTVASKKADKKSTATLNALIIGASLLVLLWAWMRHH
jgi:hypothetical protein